MSIQIDPTGYRARWVIYLDLLGFTELVKIKNWFSISAFYEKVVKSFIEDFQYTPQVEITWFSDTFLLYSSDDTASSFATIEAPTRWFIDSLIEKGIPVRGSMVCGDFYADKENNIFIGSALIEAYHYGENQDWIGFVLSPTAVNQTAILGLPTNQSINYAYWNIPYKKSKMGDFNFQESLPAYIIGRHAVINGRNPCLDKLKEMKNNLKDKGLIKKYDNTINFIEKNIRTFVKDE
jgi:hypothetical protein